jgi:hypothetical protein
MKWLGIVTSPKQAIKRLAQTGLWMKSIIFLLHRHTCRIRGVSHNHSYHHHCRIKRKANFFYTRSNTFKIHNFNYHHICNTHLEQKSTMKRQIVFVQMASRESSRIVLLLLERRAVGGGAK